jgi:UrcA family protein
MHRFTIAAIACSLTLSAAALAAPASVRVEGTAPTASGGFMVRAMTVQYDDAEVATTEGASALFARLQSGAKSVCGDNGQVRGAMASKVARCEKAALKDAVASVRALLLTQVSAAQ